MKVLVKPLEHLITYDTLPLKPLQIPKILYYIPKRILLIELPMLLPVMPRLSNAPTGPVVASRWRWPRQNWRPGKSARYTAKVYKEIRQMVLAHRC